MTGKERKGGSDKKRASLSGVVGWFVVDFFPFIKTKEIFQLNFVAKVELKLGRTQ